LSHDFVHIRIVKWDKHFEVIDFNMYII